MLGRVFGGRRGEGPGPSWIPRICGGSGTSRARSSGPTRRVGPRAGTGTRAISTGGGRGAGAGGGAGGRVERGALARRGAWGPGRVREPDRFLPAVVRGRARDAAHDRGYFPCGRRGRPRRYAGHVAAVVRGVGVDRAEGRRARPARRRRAA